MNETSPRAARAGAPRRFLLLTLAIGVALTAAPPTATRAATPSTFFAFNSVGSFVGKTQNLFITPTTGGVGIQSGATAEHIVVFADRVDADGLTEHWRLALTAGTGESFGEGVYQVPGTPGSTGLSLSGSGDACSPSNGSFEIHEMGWNGPTLIRLALTYEFRCYGDEGRGLVAGRVRINSTVPLPAFNSPAESRAMASVVAGGAGMPQTYTLTADGDHPVAFGSLTFTGSDAGSFSIGIDGCSGKTFNPGESCAFEVVFTPEASGGRLAWLEIPHDGNLSPRRLPYWGIGLIPTSTSVTGVEPTSQYLEDGVRWVFAVTPSPGGNSGQCVIDGAVVGSSVLTAGGIGYCYAPRDIGTHTVQARYLESFLHAASDLSPAVTFAISNATTTSLSASRSTAVTGEAITFTANVATASNLLYPGGQLVLRDGPSGPVLATKAVTRASPTLTFATSSLTNGTHTIVASYGGVSGSLQPSFSQLTVTISPPPEPPPTPPPDPEPIDPVTGVVDIVGHKFETDIRWLYATGITSGCSPDRFCPDGSVTRAQMASFLARALSLPATATDYFGDDEDNRHEGNIDRLRAAGITFGCAPDRFCPNGLVTRAQMASFLVRAFDLAPTATDYFTDDDDSRHESNINRLRAARITSGCASARFCPDGVVTRGQMAAFLHRAQR